MIKNEEQGATGGSGLGVDVILVADTLFLAAKITHIGLYFGIFLSLFPPDAIGHHERQEDHDKDCPEHFSFSALLAGWRFSVDFVSEDGGALESDHSPFAKN